MQQLHAAQRGDQIKRDDEEKTDSEWVKQLYSLKNKLIKYF